MRLVGLGEVKMLMKIIVVVEIDFLDRIVRVLGYGWSVSSGEGDRKSFFSLHNGVLCGAQRCTCLNTLFFLRRGDAQSFRHNRNAGKELRGLLHELMEAS